LAPSLSDAANICVRRRPPRGNKLDHPLRGDLLDLGSSTDASLAPAADSLTERSGAGPASAFQCDGAADRADRERCLPMAAAGPPGQPDGRSRPTRGMGYQWTNRGRSPRVTASTSSASLCASAS
jgi:hypothetical protein